MPRSAAPASPAGLEAITKAGALLNALARHGELTVPALARAVGEPGSSVYRMVRTLVGLGWIDPGPRRGRYRLGLGLLTTASLLEGQLDVRDAARPVLSELRRATGLTSYLCVRDGLRAVCIDRFEGQAVGSLQMRLGSSLPLYAGGAPVALLSRLPGQLRAQVLAGGPVLPGDPAAPPPGVLGAACGHAVEHGFAVSDGDVTPGVAALGAPVLNHRREVVAAISVCGLRPHVLADSRARHVRLLLGAAAEISAALGAGEPGDGAGGPARPAPVLAPGTRVPS